NPTLVSLEAYQRLDGPKRAEFERIFAQRRKPPGDLLRLRALIDESGAPRIVAEEASRWADRAGLSLEVLRPGPWRALLDRLAKGVAVRRY
ncbi:MAG: hypothetical protein L3K17_04250, partial [Thermoplasmata archaeon]|nr:hypothetical protein [Thermoplasmata archaeon]